MNGSECVTTRLCNLTGFIGTDVLQWLFWYSSCFFLCRYCSGAAAEIGSQSDTETPQEIRRPRCQVRIFSSIVMILVTGRWRLCVQLLGFHSLNPCFCTPPPPFGPQQRSMYLTVRHDAGAGLHRKTPTQKPRISSADLVLWPVPHLHGERSGVVRGGWFCSYSSAHLSCL